MKTRWDILDELAKVEDRSQQDVLAKRESMRAVLVANETNIKNGRLDFLGSIYLDCLAPNYYEKTDTLRSALILEMRRALRPAPTTDLLFDHPWRAMAIMSGVIVAILLLIQTFIPYFIPPFGIRLYMLWSVLFAVLAFASGVYLIFLRKITWRGRWNRRFSQATGEDHPATSAD